MKKIVFVLFVLSFLLSAYASLPDYDIVEESTLSYFKVTLPIVYKTGDVSLYSQPVTDLQSTDKAKDFDSEPVFKSEEACKGQSHGYPNPSPCPVRNSGKSADAPLPDPNPMPVQPGKVNKP